LSTNSGSHTAETALYLNYFRTYDPQTGRYIESDPIGLAGGINTYGYVGENPVSSVDPRGLDPSRTAQQLFPRTAAVE
jgi:RHS repeat-associated protein